ncbi:helix-turn-helix domain-containing protein [Paenibacillus thailandensis]|uniref:Helix-turn-helix domain-containing protein n=1 Tax=Paenibacillus thailandensis TaxID=393250 RepID=A0ABW5QV22_9BACL
MADLNELARQFAEGALTIAGVYRSELKPGSYYGHTKDRPTPSAGFVFALRGQASFIFDGTPYELVPGSIVHGGKRMTLRLEVGPSGFEYILIHYALNGPKGEPAGYSEAHYRLDGRRIPNLEEKLAALHSASASPGPMQAVRVKELFYGLLFHILTGMRNERNRDSTTVVEQAMEYIHGHYMEPLTLKQLADMHGLSVKRFSYLFRKYTGLFPIDYLIQHRMNRAKQLLAASPCNVNEIASSVGYADAHYFSRLFKKHTGVTPTAFRSGFGQSST